MSAWCEETFCFLHFSQLQGSGVLYRNHTIIGFSDLFPKEMKLYVFLQSIYQSLGFSLTFETSSQFQPNFGEGKRSERYYVPKAVQKLGAE